MASIAVSKMGITDELIFVGSRMKVHGQ